MASSIEPSLEHEILARAINGSEEAFATIYDQYVSTIFRFVFMRVDDRDTAEDITSITFMKAWEKLPAYKERGVPFRAWLFRIARNATIDHYRTRRPVESLDEIVGFSDPKEPSVSDTFESKLESQEVREMIRALTPLQKEVIVLKFLAGFSTSEVAEYLGKGEGAVRAIQMRALRALSSVPRESALMELASDNLA